MCRLQDRTYVTSRAQLYYFLARFRNSLLMTRLNGRPVVNRRLPSPSPTPLPSPPAQRACTSSTYGDDDFSGLSESVLAGLQRSELPSPIGPDYDDLGPMIHGCTFCGALHWISERTSSSTVSAPAFMSCCLNGRVDLLDVFLLCLVIFTTCSIALLRLLSRFVRTSARTMLPLRSPRLLRVQACRCSRSMVRYTTVPVRCRS